MLINGRVWTTFPQTHILLKASLRCTLLKTTKQWSRRSSKEGVQQWDTCREPAELIGCLTELTWTPRSKSNMSTPRTTLLTCWPKAISHVMSGTIFFMCSTLAISALNFSMFSCSHFFLSNRKQSAMSKRGFGDGEAETIEFGVAQPLEYEEEFSARHERFK